MTSNVIPFPTQDKKRQILVLGSANYYGHSFQGHDLVYVGSVVGALAWLRRDLHLIDEIWLDFEVPFDSWDMAKETVARPVGGFESEARVFIQFLEENRWHAKSFIKRIRVNTYNPAGILYMRQALKDYELWFNSIPPILQDSTQ